MQTLTRTGIQTPDANRTDSADVPRDIRQVSLFVESSVAIYSQGTLAARPTSTAGSPGKQGRFYMATDSTPHVLYYDFGTGWDTVGFVGPGSIDNSQLADNSVSLAKMQDNSVGSAEIVDGSVRGSSVADVVQEIAQGTIRRIDLHQAQLLPSAGASAASEALRSLGTGGGQACAGNDGRLSDPRIPLGYCHAYQGGFNLTGVGSSANVAIGNFAQSGTYVVFWGANMYIGDAGAYSNIYLVINGGIADNMLLGSTAGSAFKPGAFGVAAGWQCYILCQNNTTGATMQFQNASWAAFRYA